MSMINQSIFNETGIIGIILGSGTQEITGSFDATLYMIFIMILAICILFQIPLEFASVLIFPLLIVSASFVYSFWTPIILLAIYFGIILTKNFIWR